MKNLIVLLMVLVFVTALSGCASMMASYNAGYKDGMNKRIVKPFAQKAKEEAKGKEVVRTAKTPPVPAPKEFNLKVVRGTGYEMPELTDETLAKINGTITEWLKDNGWAVKEGTPFSLTITLTAYREGSATGRILRNTSKLRPTVAEKDRAEIFGEVMLLNGPQVLLDKNLPRVKTAENAVTEGKFTSIGIERVQEVFAQVIINDISDYLAGKITANK